MVTELPYGSAETVISLLLRGPGMSRRPRYIGHADRTPGYIVVLDGAPTFERRTFERRQLSADFCARDICARQHLSADI